MKRSGSSPASSGRTGLLDHVHHVAGSKELALLDVDGLARLRAGNDEVGLAAEEGGRLEHVDCGGDSRHFSLGMHVRQNRNARDFADLLQNLEALFHAEAAVALPGSTIRLVVACLEDIGNAEAAGDFLHPAGDVDRHLFALDDAGTGNQKERAAVADLKTTELQDESPEKGAGIDARRKSKAALHP